MHFGFKLRKIIIARPMEDFAFGTIFSDVPFVMFSKFARFPFFGFSMKAFTGFCLADVTLFSCCN